MTEPRHSDRTERRRRQTCATEWIKKNTDVNELAHRIHVFVLSGDTENSRSFPMNGPASLSLDAPCIDAGLRLSFERLL
jgi:hypothetical protein